MLSMIYTELMLLPHDESGLKHELTHRMIQIHIMKKMSNSIILKETNSYFDLFLGLIHYNICA